MKKKQMILSSLLLLGEIILGMIPLAVYHVLFTQSPPAPSSPWDSRPCRAAPGPLTCDGILPHAPSSLQITARSPLPGDGACIDRDSQHWSTPIWSTPLPNVKIQHPHQYLGTITLWWLPRCQSAFAQTTSRSEGDVFLAAQLLLDNSGNKGSTPLDMHVTEILAQGNEHTAWTALQWSPGVPLNACGDVLTSSTSFGACTEMYQDGRQVMV